LKIHISFVVPMTFRKESILQCHVSEKRTRQQVWK